VSRNEVVFVVSVIAAGIVLLVSDHAFLIGLVVALAAFSTLWLASLLLRDASIVDIFWGPGFVLVGWVYHLMSSPRTGLGLLVCILATAWGLRLAGHIAVRNAGAGEDYRYRQWRERSGAAFWWVSLFKVSGVAMLDRELVTRRPGYAEYIASTPAFLPFRIGPRRAAGGA
jgi:steroid 5-alpha reductase family enzyme